MATASVTSAALMMAGMLRYDRADCGGPMHTVSSASSTCLVLKSAVECTATVLMPSSRQARRIRRAISPRLAMTTFSSMGNGLLNNEQRLAEFHGLAVLDQDGLNRSGLLRFDLIHHLHRLDDAHHLAEFDFVTDLDKILGPGRGAGVVRSDHRRGHDVLAGARPQRARGGGARHARFLCRTGCDNRRRRRGHMGVGLLIAREHPRNAQAFLSLLDLDFGDARFLEQLDHLFYFPNIHD